MSFGWTYVSVLYTEGSYGVAGFRTIKENLQSSGYCLAVTRRMMRSFQPKDYDVSVCISYHFQSIKVFCIHGSFVVFCLNLHGKM